ncbi:hypothetical protein VQL36_08535 [Chengkuizengella sp. SCS-71B]|uniref:hypothetical protein n=1 Tax=Chengkuizengella sp. SCS-71B TaxID=3115290 RepID=UPI0032C22E44
MGHFDETICDCCVCPMQCILEQLIGMNVTILLEEDELEGTIIDVKNFVVSFDIENSGIIIFIMVRDVCAVGLDEAFDFKVKDIRKSKGVCSCIEEPATNLAKSMIGKMIVLVYCNELESDGTVTQVGEGIVILSDDTFKNFETIAISSCRINIIAPPEVDLNMR